jgi:hypothetical protein
MSALLSRQDALDSPVQPLLGPPCVRLHAAIKILGDKPDWNAAIEVTGRTLIAPLICSFLFNGITALIPYSVGAGSAILSIRLILTILLVVGAWTWEAVASIRAFRIVFSQNTGRAVLTWVSLPLLLLAAIWLLITIAQMMA